ncbi:MAG: hypothetical protein WCK96_07345 [Methylococcales bacterium]
MLSKIILNILIIIILSVLAWLFYTGKLSLGEQPLSKSFSQFVGQGGTDKYVIANRKTNEKFTLTKVGLVKDTNAEISLVAQYHFHIKLAELTHHVENGIVFVDVPRLYLFTPVAIDYSTVRENCNGLLGLDCDELLKQLKQDIPSELVNKGMSQINTIYDTAAKALADNLNNYFKTNGAGRYYKSIIVKIVSEGGQSQRQFDYNDSFCDKEPCLLELDVSKVRELIK